MNRSPRPLSSSVPAALLASATIELVPVKSVEAQLPHLPPNASVAVTCSPVKGLDATFDLAARLLDLGHRPLPHVSSRLVEDRAHVARIARWCQDHGVAEVFLVAGDPPQPVGPYAEVVPFLRDLLDAGAGLRRIGVAAYPDGHAVIPRPVLRAALQSKQAMLAEGNVEGWATTQMCFDAERWRAWALAERSAGLTLPLHVGLPGVVDRTKLVTMGVRLGVGASLRFVTKNRTALGRLLAPARYDPTTLLSQLGGAAAELGISGLHLFTFNNVEATEAWRHRLLSGRDAGT